METTEKPLNKIMRKHFIHRSTNEQNNLNEKLVDVFISIKYS